METKPSFSALKLKWWPSPQDYNEAVQEPLTSFSDSALKNGAIFVDALGIPKPACGAFASVYRIRSNTGQHAVRCFLRNVKEQEKRYEMITDFVGNDDLPYTVGFAYLRKGIRVNGDWFPLLKMDWVSGLTLDYHIALNFRDFKAMDVLASKFLKMCDDLRAAGVAHGDLQHGNIIVCPLLSGEELRLVDYDGMFVPSMAGFPPTELGHRNYQHPKRAAEHFGDYLDNFSAWVIYASMRSIAVDSSLFLRFKCGDDCLLFKREDFLKPEESVVFRTLESHRNEEVRAMARFIRAQLKVDPADVPPLQSEAPSVVLDDLPAVAEREASKPSSKSKSTSTSTGDTELPEWLKHGVSMAEEAQKQSNLPDWMRQDAGFFVAPKPRKNVLPKVYEPELLQVTPRKFEKRAGCQEPETLHILLTLLFFPFMLTTNVTQICSAIFLLCIFNLLVFATMRLRYGHYNLVRDGHLATGKLLEVRQLTETAVVSYEFETADGEILTETRQLTSDAFYSLPMTPGASVSVLYMPENPRKNVIYEACGYRAVLDP